MTDRCDLTDLLVDQCACRIHRPETPAVRGPIERTIRARFDGHCAECDGPVLIGELIHLRDGEWVCDAPECAT